MADDDLTEQLLDIFLYAPLGFALDAKNLLPKLAERGRGQVALTRLAGRVAVQQGRVDPSSIVGEIKTAINVIMGTDTAPRSVPSDPAESAPRGDLPTDQSAD